MTPPTCRRCAWFKRKHHDGGICWFYREGYPMGMPAKESDTCDNFAQKTIILKGERDDPKPA